MTLGSWKKDGVSIVGSYDSCVWFSCVHSGRMYGKQVPTFQRGREEARRGQALDTGLANSSVGALNLGEVTWGPRGTPIKIKACGNKCKAVRGPGIPSAQSR